MNPLASSPLLTLNPQQQDAVQTWQGPVLVLAGAGTGKTRVLVQRIVYLIQQGHARPSQILAVTFTNRAAQEMRHRVERDIGSLAQDIALGTFHSLSARMVRRHADLVGLTSTFTIIDRDDQMRLVKQILASREISPKKVSPQALIGVMDRWKDQALTPDALEMRPPPDASPLMIDLYAEYQQRLKTLNSADFGDLIVYAIHILSQNPECLAVYRRLYPFILVDEYQDTNVAQYLWLRLLAPSEHAHLCCVGDDDQSIYGWRGAEVGHILRFEQDYPATRVIRLEQNYRSTTHILGAANGLIQHNQNRMGKALWSTHETEDKVVVCELWDSEEEARFVCEEVEAFQRKGFSLSDMAILVRAGFQTRSFEERLIVVGVPYRVIGGLRFYDRAEIRDALAYLRIIHQPDDGLAFERIINVPKRGLGASSLQELHTLARDQNISLGMAAEHMGPLNLLRPAARTSLHHFMNNLKYWRSLKDHVSPSELAQKVLDESGYTAMWMAQKTVEASGRLENLKELVRALEAYETLTAFLEHISLITDQENSQAEERLNMMTLHMAKGLEFSCVFLTGWEDGLFPHSRSLEEGLSGLEEERRLAYVGLTRARRHAIITHAQRRRMYHEWVSSVPSRFIRELPEDHITTLRA